MKNFGLFAFLFITFFACSNNTEEKAGDTSSQTTEPAKVMDWNETGGQIAGAVQENLLKNLENAIASGGTASAIDYCNIRASQLVDSLSKVYNCEIARITARPRNPENKLTAVDAPSVQSVLTDSLPPHLLVESDSTAIYYQKISIGSPTCLKCHGKPGKDIEAGTLSAIKKLYPKDMAVGYALNDPRGAWKITFKK